MKPILVHTRHFPPRDYSAITLFPFVFHNERRLSERELRHETIHLWQQLALLVVLFYVLYLLFWIVGLLRYRSHDRAYRSIPFERSAYRLEDRKNLRPLTMAFDWLQCFRW
jgi:hypothetical protein